MRSHRKTSAASSPTAATAYPCSRYENRSSAHPQQVREVDVFDSRMFSTDADRGERFALGVEFDPVGGPLPDHGGYAAADHQVGDQTRHLLVQSLGLDLPYLDARM